MIRLASAEELACLERLDRLPALPARTREMLAAFHEPLPENGIGAEPALRRLNEVARDSVGNTSGPRCFHFVIGGATPAALGADMLAAVAVVQELGRRHELRDL